MRFQVYIDISDLIRTRSGTGIQRVVKEYLRNALISRYNGHKVIYYDTERNDFYSLSNEETLKFISNIDSYKLSGSTVVDITRLNNQQTTIFFEIDSLWNAIPHRTYLYRLLKDQNILIYNYIYDLIPIIKPEVAHANTIRRFTLFLSAVYRFSDMVFFDSRSSERDFLTVQNEIGVDRFIPTRVIYPGADYHFTGGQDVVKRTRSRNVPDKYILFVGTIEPRKRHDLVLDTLDSLVKNHDDICLIIIGKEGWNVDNTTERIKKSPFYQEKLFWFQDISDEELSDFYKNAYLVLYISDYEGYGLPVAESLKFGNLTITCDNSSLYEVAGDAAEYIQYSAKNELIELISLYWENDDIYTLKKDYIRKKYSPALWESFEVGIQRILTNIEYAQKVQSANKQITTIQAVIISIHPSQLKETIKKLDKHLSFIHEYLIICPANLVLDFEESIVTERSVYYMDESTLHEMEKERFDKLDHQSKNWLLRSSLAKITKIEEVFLMLDDDNRPLKSVDLDYYIGSDGQYSAFFFYDLFRWNYHKTDYDIGQHVTHQVLQKEGYELKSYSSHCPQIINKTLFREAVETFRSPACLKPLDEWSIYFNYAISKYPTLFQKKQAETMNWPAMPANWKSEHHIQDFTFENYYEHLYREGIFSDKKHLTSAEKIEIKKEELRPYERSDVLQEELDEKLIKLNMIHGVLSFKSRDIDIYLFNIPYVLTVARGAWLVTKTRFKCIKKCNKIKSVNIYYYINGDEGFKTQLILQSPKDTYNEGIVDIKILTKNLEEGQYDLLFDLEHGGIKIFSQNSPYLSKLIVAQQ